MTSHYVNLEDYPIDRVESDDYKSLIAKLRSDLETIGFINLEGFLSPDGVGQFMEEIEDRQSIAFHAVSLRHPYGYTPSDEFPTDHPRNIFAKTESYRLARHHFKDSRLDEFYQWPPLRTFIADLTGHPRIYLNADPSNALVVQVYRQGCRIAWHFDQALFSTILNLAESESGGIFECAPNLRTESDPNYAEVKSVLTGESPRVQSLKVKAGSFSIMRGRYTMHRVTPVEQDTPRVSVVLSYEVKPGVVMDLPTRRISFGPDTPELPDDQP